jgi:hypothetical protein
MNTDLPPGQYPKVQDAKFQKDLVQIRHGDRADVTGTHILGALGVVILALAGLIAWWVLGAGF